MILSQRQNQTFSLISISAAVNVVQTTLASSAASKLFMFLFFFHWIPVFPNTVHGEAWCSFWKHSKTFPFLRIKSQVCILSYKALPVWLWSTSVSHHLSFPIQSYFSPSSTSSTFLLQGLCTCCALCQKGILHQISAEMLPSNYDVSAQILPAHKPFLSLLQDFPSSLHCLSLSWHSYLFVHISVDLFAICLPPKKASSMKAETFSDCSLFILDVM